MRLNVWLHEIATNASVKGVTSRVLVERRTFPASAFYPRPPVLSAARPQEGFEAFENYLQQAITRLLQGRRPQGKRLRMAAVGFENTQVSSAFGAYLRSKLLIALRNVAPEFEVVTGRPGLAADLELGGAYWAFSDHVVVNFSLVEVSSGLQMGSAAQSRRGTWRENPRRRSLYNHHRPPACKPLSDPNPTNRLIAETDIDQPRKTQRHRHFVSFVPLW